jgi:hypothetical protein
MNTETLLGVIIVPILLSILFVSAYFLEKRAKEKGDLITGEIHNPEPGARSQFYLGLLIVLLCVAIGSWGIYINFWPLIIFGFVFFGIISISGRLMHVWELIHFSQKVLDKDNVEKK